MLIPLKREKYYKYLVMGYTDQVGHQWILLTITGVLYLPAKLCYQKISINQTEAKHAQVDEPSKETCLV